MITVDMIMLNFTFPNFNESIVNSTLGGSSTDTVHVAIGRCSNEAGTDYMELHNQRDIMCASYKPYITEQFSYNEVTQLELPKVFKSDGADVFGSSDPSGDCTADKMCAYERIYAHTDDCRAYALENERSYWLMRIEANLISANSIFTLCAVCTADFTAEDVPAIPETPLITQVSNVCVPSSGLSVGAIIGIVVGVLVAVGVVAVGVALYTGVMTPAALSFGLIGAKPTATSTLYKFPATFEVTLGGLKT
jgi:hypothetical protein